MSTGPASPLAIIEPRLRWLLPADLYVSVWLDPSPANLTRVFDHLRTLQHALYDYLPRDATRTSMLGAEGNFEWQAGTLMFTDLVGFTTLLESFAVYGRAGAEALLTVLNDYFAEMIAIISKAGGNLLEFTGDALLAQFPRHPPAQRRRAAGRPCRIADATGDGTLPAYRHRAPRPVAGHARGHP